MTPNLFDSIAKEMHELFPHAEAIVLSISDSIVVIKAFDESHPTNPDEINTVLAEIGQRFKLRTGEIAWQRDQDNLVIHLVIDSKGFSIRSAHWSTAEGETHTDNDEDSTYAVIDTTGSIAEIFNTKEEAEHFVNNGKRLAGTVVTTVPLPSGIQTIGAGTVPTSGASVSMTRFEDLERKDDWVASVTIEEKPQK